jgi:3-oxoacyl-[acyl-carrier protein] reductase
MGGASGMGETIGLTFAREGANVVIGDLDLKKANAVADKVRSTGCEALAIKVDITDEKQVAGLVKRAVERFGTIEILVNCVGIAEYAPAEEITSDKWIRMMNVNLNGMFYCCREIGREMIKRKRGKIINISSTAGLAGVPYMAHYVASKYGVVGLTKALAVEWGKHNVNVNCICPGATLTPMILSATTPKYRAERIERIPLGRLAQPEDQATAALFLASSESDYITGAVLCVDGGIFALAPSTSASALRGET